MRISTVHSALTLACLALLPAALVPASSALAYPVAFALGLDELAAQADLVCKVEVVSSKPVDDPWFDKVHGFQTVETRLKVLAVYKGKDDRKEFGFRHYALDDKGQGYNYMPQHYRLEAGRTYILLAAATDTPGVFRQLWKNHRTQDDQGLLLAASTEPHEGQSIKELYWTELTALLASKQPADVKYALHHLDELSGSEDNNRADFDREEVLDAIKRLITHANPEVAELAITVMGSRNPYLSGDFAAGWLATIGPGDLPGYGEWDRTKEYLGGKLYWKQLAAVVDSPARASTRALAIRALGRAAEPAILPLAERWTADRESQVRQAAIVLFADFPDKVDPAVVKKFATDADPAIRLGAAQAIGFGQFKSLVPVLGQLLGDADAEVAQAAAMSLLSFPLEASRDILTAQLRHPQYRPLFVNSLARENPGAYLDDLGQIVRGKLEPENWWGGSVPWGVSWDLLFHYTQKQTPADLQAGKFDRVLDSLEYPAAGDAKGPSYWGSSEPRDLYALYLQQGLKNRAAKFRAACRKTITFDIDYYFKMVDENPGNYRRE